jgi:ribosomal-protein-alanine N-acetyltransferase
MRIKDILFELQNLTTKNLILRELSLSDSEDMYEYAKDEEVAKYVLWEPHDSIDDSFEFIGWVINKYNNKQIAPWGIELKTNGKLIGTIGFNEWQKENFCAELGYAISKNYWNQGFTTEAAKAILKYGFEEIGTLREQMFVKNRFVDYKLYAILRCEYKEIIL